MKSTQQSSFRLRIDWMIGLLLLILALSSNACIVTYQVEQPTTLDPFQLPKKDLTLYYSPSLGPSTPGVSHNLFVSLLAGSYPFVSTELGANELQRVFASKDIFTQTTFVPNPPDKGLYCSASIRAHHSTLGKWISGPIEPGSKGEVIADMARIPFFAFGFLLQGSTAVVPWWSSGAGYAVEYDIYVDGKYKHTYSYGVTKKGIGWIGLLPVAWINFFTQDAKDAFRATTYQFFRDADRDGYFDERS